MATNKWWCTNIWKSFIKICYFFTRLKKKRMTHWKRFSGLEKMTMDIKHILQYWQLFFTRVRCWSQTEYFTILDLKTGGKKSYQLFQRRMWEFKLRSSSVWVSSLCWQNRGDVPLASQVDVWDLCWIGFSSLILSSFSFEPTLSLSNYYCKVLNCGHETVVKLNCCLDYVRTQPFEWNKVIGVDRGHIKFSHTRMQRFQSGLLSVLSFKAPLQPVFLPV